MEQFIGSGKEGAVYEVKVQGEKYAVKFGEDIYSTKFDVEAMRIAKEKDIDNVPQLQAYSFEDNVAVMDLIPGKNIGERLNEREGMVEIKREELYELVSTIVDLVESGLEIDPAVGNIMYSEQEGMSILDYKDYEGDLKPKDLLLKLLPKISLHLGTVVELEKDIESEIVEIWNNNFSDKYKKINKNNLRDKVSSLITK